MRALVLAAAIVAGCEAPAEGPTVPIGPAQAVAYIPGAPPRGADAAITAWFHQQAGPAVIDPVTIFYGDFNGDGLFDALAWGDLAGGEGGHLVALFRNDGMRLSHVRNEEEILGIAPRNVEFAPGRITLTTTAPRRGDARCCPTGTREWVIEIESEA